MRRWNEWNAGWQAALEQMWEGYSHNCSPIGASVCDASGNVVATARNTINDINSGLTIVNHQLAHAEANAILKLSEYTDHPDIRTYKLYTTLEPCPFCFGAIVMGSIRSFAYAARDRHAGSAALNGASPYIISKNIAVEGPVEELEGIVYAIKTCFVLEDATGRSLQRRVADYMDICPSGFAAGEKLCATGRLRGLREINADAEAAYVAAMEALS